MGQIASSFLAGSCTTIVTFSTLSLNMRDEELPPRTERMARESGEPDIMVIKFL